MKAINIENQKQIFIFTKELLNDEHIRIVANNYEVSDFETEIFESYNMVNLMPVFESYKYVLNYKN